MKTAVKGASKWLIEKARTNPKLNPIPYPMFRTILNKQIEWARTQRGQNLDFEELSELVRTELLNSGVYTMSAGKSQNEAKPERTTSSIFGNAESGKAISPLLVKFSSVGEAVSATLIFDWMARVLNRAKAEKYTGLEFTARETKEAGYA